MGGLKIKNPATGLYEFGAGVYPASNEVWDDVALGVIGEARGDSAIVVGSGNVPNIAPLIDGLGSVCFADIATGHEDVFEAKRRSLELGYVFEDDPHRKDLYTMMGHNFEDELRLEAMRFDLTRPSSPLHIVNNPKSAEDFLKCAAGLSTSTAEVDFTDPDNVSALPDELGRVAWVHISNLVPFSLPAFSTASDKRTVFGGIAAFLSLIPGIQSDTSVSFSRFTNFGSFELLVDVFNYGDLDLRVLCEDGERRDSVEEVVEKIYIS
ncbi:MAG: hypothetical protein QG623_484 [Patescibacteria group bacterium]|nr:hypothetical protein [Patescibacteria group bacterium]